MYLHRVVLDTGWLAINSCLLCPSALELLGCAADQRKAHRKRRPSRPAHSQNGWGLLAVARGRYVLAGVISGRRTRPLYGVEGWPRNRGFVSTISIAMRSGPR